MFHRILSYVLIFSATTHAFVPRHVLYPSPQFSMMKRHSIEIDNDNPTFIAKTLHDEFFKYGIPQSYDGFLQQLKEKHIESVSLVTQNNEINGLISIDTLHKPHEYDMINAHLVQVVPAMSASILQKLDDMNIRYDLFIQETGSPNVALGFVL